MASPLDEELNEKLAIGAGQPVQKFPLKNTQVAAIIDGNHTEFILSKYSNCIFVMITQLGKPGTIVKNNLFSFSFYSCANNFPIV